MTSHTSTETNLGPLDLHRGVVLPEWADYNGHMNLAYYLLAFDQATDRFFDNLELGHAYRLRANRSLFTLEAHVTYEHELDVGMPFRCTTQLVDYDHKRLHYFHRMYHGTEGFLAATNELLSIHVDLASRRSAELGADALDRLARLMSDHGKLSRPPQLGRVMQIRHKR